MLTPFSRTKSIISGVSSSPFPDSSSHSPTITFAFVAAEVPLARLPVVAAAPPDEAAAELPEVVAVLEEPLEGDEVLTEPSELRFTLVPDGVVIVTEDPEGDVETSRSSSAPSLMAAMSATPNTNVSTVQRMDMTKPMMPMTLVGVCLVE